MVAQLADDLRAVAQDKRSHSALRIDDRHPGCFMIAHSLIVTQYRLRNLDQNVYGVYQRLRLLVEAVCGVSDRVDILCLTAPPDDPAEDSERLASDELHRVWGVRCRVFHGAWRSSRSLWPWFLEQASWALSYRRSPFISGLDNPTNLAALRRLTDPAPKLIVAHKLPVMELVRTTVATDIPVLFDIDDLEHIAVDRSSEHASKVRDKVFARAMVPAIRRAERRAIGRATRTLVCSELDKHTLMESFAFRSEKFVVIQNSCSIRQWRPVVEAPVLLFVGNLGYPPNVQAIEFFLGQCWMRVKSSLREARLLIVGRMPERVPSFSRNLDGVEFTGFLEDIETPYGHSRVVICPILAGGGTRVKLVEAAAFGKPIVSTHVGAEGLEFKDGYHALLRDDAKGFADACIRLLQDNEACARLSANVYAHALAKFERNAVLAGLRDTVRACAPLGTEEPGFESR